MLKMYLYIRLAQISPSVFKDLAGSLWHNLIVTIDFAIQMGLADEETVHKMICISIFPCGV